jgi:PAS domain-containing protein
LILARSLSENLAVPCFVINDGGAVVWFNESAERLIGRSAPETPELSASELVDLLAASTDDGSPVDPETLPFFRALADRIPAVQPLRVSGADGTEWVDSAALPLLGPDGELLGVLFACYPGKSPA